MSSKLIWLLYLSTKVHPQYCHLSYFPKTNRCSCYFLLKNLLLTLYHLQNKINSSYLHKEYPQECISIFVLPSQYRDMKLQPVNTIPHVEYAYQWLSCRQQIAWYIVPELTFISLAHGKSIFTFRMSSIFTFWQAWIPQKEFYLPLISERTLSIQIL